MGRYFMQETPQADIERLMMKVPNSDKSGDGDSYHNGFRETLLMKGLSAIPENTYRRRQKKKAEVIS